MRWVGHPLKMGKIRKIAQRIRSDDSGAAMIEYSVVIGTVTAAVIAIAILVGNYVSGTWSDLASTLPEEKPAAAAAAARPAVAK
jgi:pilus assembly protein Flp/PilA